jgi:hypothetical protein
MAGGGGKFEKTQTQERVVVITWMQILDPGRRILHHWITPHGFNLDCRRWLKQLLTLRMSNALNVITTKPSPAAEVESRQCNPMMQNPVSCIQDPKYYNYHRNVTETKQSYKMAK